MASLRKSKYIVFDVESGGLDPKLHPITQFACKVMEADDNGNLQEVFEWETIVKPYDGKVITDDGINFSRLTRAQIMKEGISKKEFVKSLKELFTGCKVGRYEKPILVGHNIDEFDIPMLEEVFDSREELLKYVSANTIDTIALSKMFSDVNKVKESGLKLGQCCERVGITLSNAHEAMADVRANTKLFNRFFKMLNVKSNNQDIVEKSTARKHFKF